MKLIFEVRRVLISVFLLSHLASVAQSSQRNFKMGLWFNPAAIDSDISFFAEGQVQPDGYSVLILSSWRRHQFREYWTQTIEKQYDLTRIKAVLVDEPYLAGSESSGSPDWSTPCKGTRKAVLEDNKRRLKNVAKIVKATSNDLRFWINFSEPETNWMMDVNCPANLYEDYIDVVSVDIYWRPFSVGVQNYYEWFLEHRIRTTQQIALIPGTFFRKGVDVPEEQASLLQEFFDYASRLNEFCNPQNDSPSAGNEADPCVVWIVAGWLAEDYQDSNSVLWCGEQDPESEAIRSVWQKQLLSTTRKKEEHATTVAELGAGSCPLPRTPGTNVCTPVSGQTYNSPVLVTGAGKECHWFGKPHGDLDQRSEDWQLRW